MKDDGTVIAWGDNRSNQTQVPNGLTNVIQILALGSKSIALKSDGTIVSWGRGEIDFDPPVGLTDVKAIAASSRHMLALKKDGILLQPNHASFVEINFDRLSDIRKILGRS